MRKLRTGPLNMAGVFICCLLPLLLLSLLRKTMMSLSPDTAWSSHALVGRHSRDVAEENVKDLVVRPVHTRMVIYNRVPKCASATMLRICLRLSSMNEFSFNNMRDVSTSYQTLEEQQQLADWIFKKPSSKRHFFFQHMNYVNFSMFGYWEPTFINVVRHPVKRFISFYYYKKPLQTLDVCIKDKICKFQTWKYYVTPQITYFCGYDSFCREEGNRQALQRAKQMVERKFVVVGLQEELRSTLFLLESLLPTFFDGATRIDSQTFIHKLGLKTIRSVSELLTESRRYCSRKGSSAYEYENFNVQSAKPPTSNETLAVLEQRLKLDIEFYEYLKQRFFAQLEAVKRKQKEDSSEESGL